MGPIKPKESIEYLRRRKTRAIMLIASSFMFGVVSLLWVFSSDYNTLLFKISAAAALMLFIAFMAGVWIYSGAQLDLEEHLQRTRKAAHRR